AVSVPGVGERMAGAPPDSEDIRWSGCADAHAGIGRGPVHALNAAQHDRVTLVHLGRDPDGSGVGKASRTHGRVSAHKRVERASHVATVMGIAGPRAIGGVETAR